MAYIGYHNSRIEDGRQNCKNSEETGSYQTSNSYLLSAQYCCIKAKRHSVSSREFSAAFRSPRGRVRSNLRGAVNQPRLYVQPFGRKLIVSRSQLSFIRGYAFDTNVRETTCHKELTAKSILKRWCDDHYSFKHVAQPGSKRGHQKHKDGKYTLQVL